MTLDPQSLLLARPPSPPPARAGRPTCGRPARIVAEHPRRQELGDRRLALGLQCLVVGGALAVIKEA